MALIAARDMPVTLTRKLFFDMLPLRICVGLGTRFRTSFHHIFSIHHIPHITYHISYIIYHVSCWILQDHATFFDL
jgi:hypothetical protein